jgi:hypothetical protein
VPGEPAEQVLGGLDARDPPHPNGARQLGDAELVQLAAHSIT